MKSLGKSKRDAWLCPPPGVGAATCEDCQRQRLEVPALLVRSGPGGGGGVPSASGLGPRPFRGRGLAILEVNGSDRSTETNPDAHRTVCRCAKGRGASVADLCVASALRFSVAASRGSGCVVGVSADVAFEGWRTQARVVAELFGCAGARWCGLAGIRRRLVVWILWAGCLADVLLRLGGGFARRPSSRAALCELITVNVRVFLDFRSLRSVLLCGRLTFIVDVVCNFSLP